MATLRVTNLRGRTSNVAPDLPDGANITGFATATNVNVSAGVTAGIGTFTTSVVVGSAVTVNSDGLITAGIVTATTFQGNVNGTTGTFSGAVSIGGTLTYEDVERVDATGLSTFREGLNVGSPTGVGGTFNPQGDISAGIGSFSGALSAGAITGTTGTFSGEVSLTGFDSNALLREKCNVTAGKLSDNLTINLDNGMVHLFTTTESTVALPNIMSSVGINTQMGVGDAISVTLVTTANANGYITNIQIDGAAVTENWVGGSTPSDGGSSGVDINAFTIIKTASETFTVVGNQTKTS